MADTAEALAVEQAGPDADQAHIRVAVRVRPVPVDEDSIIEVAGSVAIAVRKEAATGGNEFLRSQQGRTEERMFDRVFGPDATQEEVYSWSCQPLVGSAVHEGRNATVFVYGATGAGKTHTMFGERDEASQGLIYRAVREVFGALDARQNRMDPGTRPLSVKLAFLDIYNETVRDLLCEGGSICKVLEDARGGVVKVQNLREIEVSTAEDALRLLRTGLQNRKVEATAANARSSRSHAVLSLTLERVSSTRGHGDPIFQRQGKEVRTLYSRISLIDLAGSERATQTLNTGQALKDGAKINQSLLALANCIDALTNRGNTEKGGGSNRKKPPYRDSKLTLLLKGSLTSDCLVSMIANVHPGRDHFEDSNNTLEYAKRASLVKAPVLVRRARAASLPGRAPSESPRKSCRSSTGSSSSEPSADERPKLHHARSEDFSARQAARGQLSARELAARDRATGGLAGGSMRQSASKSSLLEDGRSQRRLAKPSISHRRTKFEQAHTEPISAIWQRAAQQEDEAAWDVAPLPDWHGGHVFGEASGRPSGARSPRSSTSSFSTARGSDAAAPLTQLHAQLRGSPGGPRQGREEVRARASPGQPVSPLDLPENSPRTAVAARQATPAAAQAAAAPDPLPECPEEPEAEAQQPAQGSPEFGPTDSARLAEALQQEALKMSAERSTVAAADDSQPPSRIPRAPAARGPSGSPGSAPAVQAPAARSDGAVPTGLARSPSVPVVQRSTLEPAPTASQDPRVLMAIIETLQKDKALLDGRVSALLQERRRLEAENAEHRAAGVQKDRQIARLLACAHQEPKRPGMNSTPTPARCNGRPISSPSRNSPLVTPRSGARSAR